MAKGKTKAQLETELQAAQLQIAELQLRLEQVDAHSAEKLRQLLELLPVGISIMNADRQVVFENPALQNMISLNAEQLRNGQYWQRQYLAADGSPMPAEGFASAQSQRSGTPVNDVETGIVKEDGQTIWLNVSAVPVDFPDWKTVVVSSEITERKQAEVQLHKVAERLNLATQAARLGIWDWDIQQNQLVWDDQMYALYGLKPGEFGGAYEAGLNGVHPEDRESSDAISAAAVRGERDYDTEFRVVWPDGSIHWLKAHGTVFHDEHGTPLRMVGLNYDITPEKHIAAELKQSEQRYSAMFEKSAVPVALTKMPAGVFVDVNEAFQATYGYTREEVIGKTSVEIGMARPEERSQTYRELQASPLLRDNEKHLFTKTGQARIGAVNINRILIEGQEYVITTIHDVTERKQAEAALFRSQVNFSGAFEANPAGLAITRQADGKFIRINPAYSALMGYSAAELIGHTVTEFSIYVNPVERQQLLQQMLEQGAVHNYELAVRGQDGKVHDILVSMEPVQYDQEDCLLSAFIDITERQQAEARIAYQAHLLANVYDAIVGTDTELHISYWNKAAEEIFGWTAAEVLGQATTEVLKTQFLNSSRAEILQKLLEQDHYDGELRYARKSGDYFEAHARSVVLKDAQGHFTGLVSSIRDITKQKQLEASLRDSEQRYTLLFQKASIPVLLVKLPQVLIADANEAAEKLTGYTREEMLGRNAAELRLISHTQRTETITRFEQERALADNEMRIITKSGAEHIIIVNTNPLEIDQQPFAITSMQDITELKQAEQDLRAQAEQLREQAELLEHAHVLIRDLDNHIVMWNSGMEHLYGWSKAEALGQVTHTFFQTHFPQSQAAYEAELLQKGEWEGELTHIRKDGQKIVVVGHHTLYRDQVGQPLLILEVNNDITERKLMEEDLRRSNAELEQFAYVASHDLQEPLRAVAGMVHLLGQRYQGQLDERADEYIGHAIEAAGRMQALINDLLAYSRVERRNKPLEPVPAADCLQAALKNLATLIHDTQAEVTADPLPTVQADATQLLQLFQNLIGNGIKFRGQSAPQVHISVTQFADAWQFTVRDNGIGIEPEYFERIFQVFQRLHTRREYAGTGIGLAICKKIVERHGGRIWVESTPGTGSTFYFTLPIRNTQYDRQLPTQTH